MSDVEYKTVRLTRDTYVGLRTVLLRLSLEQGRQLSFDATVRCLVESFEGDGSGTV